MTGVDLLVLCECNETESSGPKLSKKCEASGKQTNKQNAAQLLIFGLFINQISKYFAYYANCKTKEMGNRLNNRIEENYYDSKKPSEKCCVEFEPKDKNVKANTRGKGNVIMN